MMHSSPIPLKTALDVARRLRHELTRHLTPEQQRDFGRLERLINEAHEKRAARSARDHLPARR